MSSASLLPTDRVPNPYDVAGFQLWQSANEWERFVNTALEPFGVNQSEVFQLISLVVAARQQEGVGEVTQVLLAQLTGTHVMTVSKILRSLEKKQLIVRTVGRDARAKALRITKAGEQLLIETTGALMEANNNFFPAAGRAELVAYLQTRNSTNT